MWNQQHYRLKNVITCREGSTQFSPQLPLLCEVLSSKSAWDLLRICVQFQPKLQENTHFTIPSKDYSTQEIPVHLLTGSRVQAANPQFTHHSYCTASCKARKGKVHRSYHQFSSAQAFSQEGVLWGGRCRRKQGREGSSSISRNLAAPTLQGSQSSPSIPAPLGTAQPISQQAGVGQETILNQLLPNRPSNSSQPFRTWQPNLN